MREEMNKVCERLLAYAYELTGYAINEPEDEYGKPVTEASRRIRACLHGLSHKEAIAALFMARSELIGSAMLTPVPDD